MVDGEKPRKAVRRSVKDGLSIVNKDVLGLNSTETTNSTIQFSPLMSKETSDYVGAGVGAVFGASLTVTGLICTRTRCTAILMIPSILTKRGRAFMITFAIGMLFQGPFKTLEFNLEEISRSYTCMFSQIKDIVIDMSANFPTIIDQYKGAISHSNEAFTKYMADVETLVQEQASDLSDEIAAAKAEVQGAIDEITEITKDIGDAVDSVKGICDTVSGLVGSVIDLGCDLPSLDVDLDIDVLDGLNTDQLKDIAKQ